MKKVVVGLICAFLLLVGNKVMAKDTVYSFNKYKNEKLNYIIKDENDKGYVVAGTIKQKNENHIILIHYNKTGSMKWNYIYDVESELIEFKHSYDENHEINGYLALIKKDNISFHQVDLKGKFIEEKTTNLYTTVQIEKMIEADTGYLLIGNMDGLGFIANYDIQLNMVWIKTYENTTNIIDLINTENGIYIITEKEDNSEKTYQLVKMNQDGNIEKTIKDDLEKNEVPHLISGNNFFLVYGTTKEVKLSDDQIGSYYIIKYNNQDEIEWDTVGNTFSEENSLLKMQTIEDDYYLLSINNSDDSYEVTKINSEGIIQEKIKKIKNNYYEFEDFYVDQDTLLFIGQINCPEEDNCEYEHNSLFLVCSEDKVIEVKDKDSKNILFVIGTIIVVIIIIYGIKKRKTIKKKH